MSLNLEISRGACPVNNQKITEIRSNIEKVIIGKSQEIDLVLTALLAGALNYGGYADEEALQRLDSFRAATGQGRDLSARRLYQRLAEEPPFAVLCFKNWSVLTQWSRIQGLTPTQSNVFHAFDQWVLT